MEDLLIFLQSFFGAPAILVALFALVGSILEKRKASEVFTSVIYAGVGYIGITSGAVIIGLGLQSFGKSFELLFGISGTMPYTDITAANIMQKYDDIASLAALTMLIAMILNITLARLSRFKYIFLTGHHVLFMSVCLIAFISAAGYDTKIDIWAFIILGGFIMAIYMTLSPMLSKQYMEFLTQDNKIYIGHFNSIGFALAGAVGNLYGKIKKNKVVHAKDINFPKWLGFFRNQIVSLSLTMIVILNVLYCSLWAINGIDFLVENSVISSKTMSPIVQALLDSFTFVIGVEFLIYGVKMMLGELVPAIEGFSKKVIPGAKTGVDCGIVLHFQPTAVLIGFLSSLIGGITGMALSIWFNILDPIYVPAIILPGIVSHFFTGGTSGTFADIKGGVVGATLGSFIQGIMQTIIPILFIALSVKYSLLFDANITSPWETMYTESDFGLVLAPLGLILISLSPGYWIVFGIVIVVFIALIIDGILKNKRNKDKDNSSVPVIKQEKTTIIKTDKKVKTIKPKIKMINEWNILNYNVEWMKMNK